MKSKTEANIVNIKRQLIIEYSKLSKKALQNKPLKLALYLANNLESQNFQLKRLNLQKQRKLNIYFSKLDRIYHSRTWKLLGLYKKIESFLIKPLKIILPLALRKKLKSRVDAIITHRTIFNIPQNIKNEFSSRKIFDNTIDIIDFGVIAWNFRFQRPQQLAKQLAIQNNRIFYIKNEFTPGVIENGFAPFLIEKIDNNIYEVTLSASRNLFIYDDKPSTKDISIINASLKNLIYSARVINPIAKLDHPFWTNIIDKLGMPIVYDCMDNHQGFNDNGDHLVKLEQKLFEKADINLVSSHYLEKVAKKYKAKNISLVPNASDYQHFSPAVNIINPIPNDIKNIPHPIIGYYGAISNWFDTSILSSLAKDHPDKSIVLIGQVTNNKVEKLSRQYKNIHLLGEKNYQELPAYLSQFDVCIIPFIINELIKATHPVKIYEYLSAGKPVVTTQLPEIIDLKEHIFYTTAKDFSNQVNFALDAAKVNIPKRQQIAKDNTWETRSDQILNLLKNRFFPKVSIIILSYNHPDLMKLTLDSVLKRSFYPNLEIIVVDNASNKETIDLLKQYKNKKNIKLIFNKINYGFAKGNNIGLKASTGEYIILLNNDVVVTPGWVSRLLYHLKKENVGLVGPVTNSIGNEAKIDINYNPNMTKEMESKSLEYTSKHWGDTLDLKNIAAFCWIMARSTYDKLGGLDERFGRGMFEDDDYCHRVIKNKQKIMIADDVFIHHFGGASFKQIQSSEYKRLFDDNKQIFEKKWKTKWIPHSYRLNK